MPITLLRTGAFAVAVIAMTANCGLAQAADSSVERACASDYFAYCSQHDPDGPGVRKCMKSNGSRLSQRCLNALVAAGEVSKSDLERRTARK
jgi:hypothetical protein